MTADEIMHALRLTAMGRINTQEQQRLCEALAAAVAKLQSPENIEALAEELMHVEADPGPANGLGALLAPKRTRKAKAA